MTTVTGTSSSTSGATTTTKKVEDPQDRFLKLLTTQLKNQDPLNPMDNAEMTSQLAQMSTVSGIEKLNTTLNSLVDSIGNSQAMQAAEMIGKNVLVAGSTLSWSDGVAYGGVNLASAADEVTVSILNSAGTVVQTQTLGSHEAGSFTFSWDGKTDAGATAPEGVYKFKVEASQGGSAVTVDALQIGTVSALVRSSDGFLLDLGSLGSVDFDSVYQVL